MHRCPLFNGIIITSLLPVADTSLPRRQRFAFFNHWHGMDLASRLRSKITTSIEGSGSKSPGVVAVISISLARNQNHIIRPSRRHTKYTKKG